MAPYNVTRYFNGDMAASFMNSITINQSPDQAMFDPNSGYNPNKASSSKTTNAENVAVSSSPDARLFPAISLQRFDRFLVSS